MTFCIAQILYIGLWQGESFSPLLLYHTAVCSLLLHFQCSLRNNTSGFIPIIALKKRWRYV